MRKVLAVFTLALLSACSGDAPDSARPFPTSPSGARIATSVAISPANFAVAVGDTVIVSAVYTGLRKNDPRPFTLWGCNDEPLYNPCWSTITLHGSYSNDGNGALVSDGTAAVVGLAPGTVTIHAIDGFGHWGFATVPVVP
jgi:hypothetical protein